MRELPAGYFLRRPDDSDASPIVTLKVACDLEVLGEPDSTLDDVKAEWALPRFDRERDAWLVLSQDGDVVGYAWVWDRVPHQDLQADLLVHPEHRDRGIEDVLLRLIEERGGEHRTAKPPGANLSIALFVDPEGNLSSMLGARGYELARTFLRMRIDLDGPPPPGRVPDGIEIRPFRRNVDERTIHEIIEESFEAHFRFAPEPHDDWVTRRVSYPSFEPGLWRIAWDRDQGAGAVLPYRFDDLGWIRELGVRPAWRGRGIGKALLLEAFRALSQRGHRRICLGVDAQNASGATRLYEDVGMRVELRNDLYQKILAPAG
jgi:mycothiol synthase